MNKSLFLLLVLLLTGCATFQVSTLNHDPIYAIEGSDVEINVINNEFELQRLLRTDFNFRFDFAQYALRQPRSFDWNNRVLGNRYSFYNPYYSRTQMWNDWAWGYNWYSPHPMSSFGNNWGPYPYYGWNNYGWRYNNRWGYNRWNNWNYGYYRHNYNRYRGTNTAYHTGRRGSTMSTQDRVGNAAMIESSKRRVVNNNRVVTTPRTRTVIKNKPRVINNKPRINNPRPIPRQRVNTPTRTRSIPNTSTRSSNATPTRSNSRRKN